MVFDFGRIFITFYVIELAINKNNRVWNCISKPSEKFKISNLIYLWNSIIFVHLFSQCIRMFSMKRQFFECSRKINKYPPGEKKMIFLWPIFIVGTIAIVTTPKLSIDSILIPIITCSTIQTNLCNCSLLHTRIHCREAMMKTCLYIDHSINKMAHWMIAQMLESCMSIARKFSNPINEIAKRISMDVPNFISVSERTYLTAKLFGWYFDHRCAQVSNFCIWRSEFIFASLCKQYMYMLDAIFNLSSVSYFGQTEHLYRWTI